MTKQEFLSDLEDKLSNLPKKDVAERIKFYEEMIDDRLDEGLSEEEAINDIGSVDEIYDQFVKELPLLNIIKDKIKPKQRLSGGTIAIIASTSILWFPLLIVAFSVVLSLVAVLWSLVLSAWAIVLSFAVCSPVGILCGLLSLMTGNMVHGLLFIGTSLICAGVAIFAYFGSLYATKGSIVLMKKMIVEIKNLIIK